MTTSVEVKQKQSESFLEKLKIYGLSHLEPIIFASLAQEKPVLLISEPGCAKTLLCEKIFNLLGLKYAHYNASQVCIDDLIGYPSCADGKIVYLPTPASCWDLEAIFIDEISRCKPETQNKFFSIIYEKKLMGIKLEKLIYRWAAMNPPKLDEFSTSPFMCEGSFPLDAALADRFSYIIKFPNFYQLSEKEQKLIINVDNADIEVKNFEVAYQLKEIIEKIKTNLCSISQTFDDKITNFVYVLMMEMDKYGYSLSGRRARILYENLLYSITAFSIMSAYYKDFLSDIILVVVRNSIPHRAYKEVDEDDIENIIKRSIILSKIDSNVKRIILIEKDLVERVFIAISNLDDVDEEFVNNLIEDAVFKLPEHKIICFVLLFYRILSKLKLSARVAEELSKLFLMYAEPIRLKNKRGPEILPLYRKRNLAHFDYSEFLEQVDEDEELNEQEKDVLKHAIKYYAEKNIHHSKMSDKELSKNLTDMIQTFKRYLDRLKNLTKEDK